MRQHAAAKGAIAERLTPKLSFSIFVRICSTKRAPHGVHCISCFLTKRLLTSYFTVDSAKAVLQIRPRVLNKDWEDTFRGWYPGFRPKLENEIKQAA